MYIDKQNLFDNDVALTATRVSINAVDLGRASQNLGAGESLFVYFTVTTILDSSGEGATLNIGLITDDDAALGSPVVIQDQPAVITEATLVAGYEVIFRIKPYASMLQYLGIAYTVGTENFTSGKITCGLVHDVPIWAAYPKNYVTA